MKNIREIKVTNTATKKKEILKTVEAGKLKMYSCGPTVYGLIHIGNLRAACTPDLFFRYFKRVGYDVNYVRNYTDVDDKIIKRGQTENCTPAEIALKYISEVEKDYAMAGLKEPTHKTTVTGHMAEIITMVQKLIANKKAYVVETPEGGEVLYSIESFEHYGKLSGKKIEDLEAGARVEVSDRKRNPMDFALWKPAKAGEPFWPSPWGNGRPGWHIECSAMASRWLGDEMDIHHGGEDLIFPHHENEIAQSEGASGHSPYVRYWMHNAFLNIDQVKMSKSLGNFTTARDFLSKYGREVTRALLLSVHYRSILDLGRDSLEQTLTALSRVYEAKKAAVELTRLKVSVPDQRAESLWGEFIAEVQVAKKEIDDQFANDFNTPGVMAALFSLIRVFNRTLAEPKAQGTPAAILGAQALIEVMEQDVGEIMGILQAEPTSMLEQLGQIRADLPGHGGSQKLSPTEIVAMIEARKQARAAKNFAEGDRIRKELADRGVAIKDSPQGTTWEYV